VRAAIYALSAISSLVCVMVLLRAYFRSRARLVLWSGLCFMGYFVSNGLLMANVPGLWDELSPWRVLPALAGTSLLVFGMIWETRT
jgi:hypothetical protein